MKIGGTCSVAWNDWGLGLRFVRGTLIQYWLAQVMLGPVTLGLYQGPRMRHMIPGWRMSK